ncbi:MAG: hypothetical protein KDD62_10180 [Bdellovibrionales bacterium]|nr:hypothetical protein [Bdellovibrionales bacterium]
MFSFFKVRYVLLIGLVILLLRSVGIITKDIWWFTTRSAWVTEFSDNFPEKLCQPGTIFNECFDFSSEQCQSVVVNEFLPDCIAEHELNMPYFIGLPADGQEFGGKIGLCVGNGFEENYASRLNLTDACLKGFAQIDPKASVLKVDDEFKEAYPEAELLASKGFFESYSR